MTEEPDFIYAGADCQDGWRWPVASKFPMQHPTSIHAFVRIDSLPDQIDLYRAIKKSGARKHGEIAKVIADMLKFNTHKSEELK